LYIDPIEAGIRRLIFGEDCMQGLFSTAARCGLLVFLLAGPTAASAQDVGEENPSADAVQSAQAEGEFDDRAESSSGGFDDIVVTARRRAENLRDVPISIVAVSGDIVADRNIVQQQDLAVYIPNFRQNNGSVSVFRFIRGAGSGSNRSFDQAVGSFFDGVYAGRGELARLPFYDLERVEVLRGPQVILFGNSTTAGAVNVTTKKPGSTFGVEASGAYEFENQELLLQGAVNVPVTDRFAIRVAGLSQTLDRGDMHTITPTGTRRDTRYSNQSIRVTAQIEPVNDVTLTLKYEKNWLNVYGSTLQAISNALNNPAITETKFDRVRFVANPAPFGFRNNDGVPEDFTRLNPEVFYANADISLGDLSLTSTTAWLGYDFAQSTDGDLTQRAIFNFAQEERYRQFSQELRASVDVGAIDIQVGGYYQNDHVFAAAYTDTNLAANGLPVPAFARRNEIDQHNDTWSVFADTTLRLSPRFRIGIGARYLETKRTVDQIYRAANVGTWEFNPAAENLFVAPLRSNLFQFAFGAPHEFRDVRISEKHFMPQALVQYDVTDDIMMFAKVVKGAKSGGYDWLYAGTVAEGGIFRPEKAVSYEIGLKALLFDRTVSLDLAAYRTDFTNLQVSIFNGSTNFVVGNAAESRSQGVELEASWRITPNLTLSTVAAYLDSKYLSFPGAGCYFEQRATTPAGQVCVQDLSGAETPYSSKWSGSAGLEYVQPVGSLEVIARVDANFRSTFNPSLNNDPLVQQKGFTLLDARLAISPETGPWTLALFGKNLTNKLYTDQTSDTPIMTGSRFATINRGRQIGVQVGFKF
jgi:outer membrane receptor protein involved in Fe transport